MAKSLIVTYVLWFFGGFFGLHHVYLGRDYQALLWWMFPGGYFGIGWIRDLWRVPAYVKDANNDANYLAKLAKVMKRHEKPPHSTIRFIAQLSISDAFGYLIIAALPQELMPEVYRTIIAAIISPFAVAVGVYMVGNIGRVQGKFSAALIGAYIALPAYFIVDNPPLISSFLCTMYFGYYGLEWRRVPYEQKSLCRRTSFFLLCGSIYLMLWGSWLYFNCQVEYQQQGSDEQTVKCRDAAQHFFSSPIWKEFQDVIQAIWRVFKQEGLSALLQQIVLAFDPVGEIHALKVLGLNLNATQQDITSRYRKLSRDWHPDRHHSSDQKKFAQDKFIEIQKAYETLSKIKSERLARNVKDPNAA